MKEKQFHEKCVDIAEKIAIEVNTAMENAINEADSDNGTIGYTFQILSAYFMANALDILEHQKAPKKHKDLVIEGAVRMATQFHKEHKRDKKCEH